jgi:toxin FitB
VIHWLLDTNVISELRKPRCDANVRSWTEEQPASSLHISRVTFAEIRFGISRLDLLVEKRAALQTWLDRDLRGWFADRLIEVDEDVLLLWRQLMALGNSRLRPFIQPDMLVAACALRHDMTVVTRNTDDYQQAGVPVVNPWLA